ncbi:tryptophan halogenase family protein [Luteolibacter luteus]|uniref:Tryptophan 7-halogenase n=1 Tax=Luteolibacter luteus TaxID=2728835 RepID=A0A858RCE9_9BACT|nr:tryptophan halogenase family protein [Luteolibacter luteus]QJE94321.1 tryptophan 7-halogenase [Luteolibacter luteus]
MIQNVLVLGGGSAGFIAAISIKRKIPQLRVTVVRSPAIGVIGVGESTTPNFPRHLFDYLGISRKRFYALAQPTWKLGIRFLWGSRGSFDYTFNLQLDSHYGDLDKPTGYYCDDDFNDASLPGALMRRDLAFPRQADGSPEIHGWHAFHIENKKFIEILEIVAKEEGVEVTDGKVTGSERGPSGIEAVHLEDGRRLTADLFVDASGFRSELLGKALEEPFISFDKSLFCSKAVIGGWERGPDEPILPYTTAETMDAGWAWRIDHEHLINRGYVYCPEFISDDEAAAEFQRKNPKAKVEPRIVNFRSGHYRRQWVDNVVAFGNSGGFVEPLESTAIMILCAHVQTLVDFLLHSSLEPTPTMRNLYNDLTYSSWEDIRHFLSLHYKFNGMLDTPFWKHAREDTDVSGIADFIEFYQENGPTGFCRYRMPRTESDFGLEGFLVMMVGNQVPYKKRHQPSQRELETWARHKQQFAREATKGIRCEEALAYVKHPGWRWNGDPAN